jgi:hypothetical protein
MPQFKAGTPPYCPEVHAIEWDGVFYRACDTLPPTVEDFTSHAHSEQPKKRRRAKPDQCLSWGLSGWVTQQDATHAREMFDWLKRKFFVRFEVAKSDGRLAQTGTPPHHTLWPYEGVELQFLNRATSTNA